MNKGYFLAAIIDIKQSLVLKENLFISVYLYGSVTRFEAIERVSDIDLLFVYEKKLDKAHIDFLIELKQNIKIKYGILLHTRLRILNDLFSGRSGVIDCGFTSFINKLRDGIVLYGLDLSTYYYYYIKQSSEKVIKDNLIIRWQEICYRNLDIFQHEENHKKQLLYVLSSMSELICYSQGVFSLGTKDSLEKAFQMTGLNIFNDYWKIKRGEIEDIDISVSIEKNEEIIDIYASPNNWKNLLHLKDISLIEGNQDELYVNYSILEKKELMENMIIPKKCEIINNNLLIYYKI